MFRCDIITCASLYRLHELYMSDSRISLPVKTVYAGNQSGEAAFKLQLKDVYRSRKVTCSDVKLSRVPVYRGYMNCT